MRASAEGARLGSCSAVETTRPLGLLWVPEEGSEPESFTVPDAESGERRLHQPHFLPDGRTLLYTGVTRAANEGDIAVDRDGVRTYLRVGDGAVQPAYSATGHIVFARKSGGSEKGFISSRPQSSKS